MRSGWERKYAKRLDLLVKAGEIAHWEYELERHCWMGGSYLPDFWVILPDGSVEVHEVKGRKQGIQKFKKFARDTQIPCKLICDPKIVKNKKVITTTDSTTGAKTNIEVVDIRGILL